MTRPPRLAFSSTVLAAVTLGSGAALLAAIFLAVSLQLALLVAIMVWGVVVAYIWFRSDLLARQRLRAVMLRGAVAGFVATLAYDASRWALSHLDPAPYNPFEAMRVFGVLLTGSDLSQTSTGIMAAGIAYHLLNGTSFGLAYSLLLGRRDAGFGYALLTGTAWGVGLELMQLTVYPGWLDIRAYDEFVRVSFLGHVVYGSILGLGTRYLLRRLPGGRPVSPPPRFTNIHG